MKRPFIRIVLAFCAICALSAATAQIVLHEFAPGETILSSEVNENFEALRDGIATAVGDAQARRFAFTIEAADWGFNLHYGDNNIHRRFDIPAEVLGGTTLADVWSSGGAILAYARPEAASSYGELKPLPHMYSSSVSGGDIGIKLELIIPRNAIAISRTTGGWDNLNLSDTHLPATVDVVVFLIPARDGP